MNKTVNVVAGAIVSAGRLFATQRGYGDWAGWWEFPGGKIEPGEAPEEALRRELREELALEVRVGEEVARVEYDYPKFHLSMRLFLCTPEGEPTLKEHSAARWLSKDELEAVRWLPADKDVIHLIHTLL
ncbi:MAG: (deoxy)nucleoside triphosphate pyrophosphohydrolase [Bacteroidales bacterium]|nr:(deoxy)nucleoside triphosphate pyrophosphohydrolase [Bacteroidales bacterium]